MPRRAFGGRGVGAVVEGKFPVALGGGRWAAFHTEGSNLGCGLVPGLSCDEKEGSVQGW